jgi:hypothetical protein
MEWTDVLIKALVALAAVAGAIAAVFKWITARRHSRAEVSSRSQKNASENGPVIQAGRDVHFINKSFNKTTGRD